MKKRIGSIALLMLLGLAGLGRAADAKKGAGSSIEKQLEAYAVHFLPFDPETKVTVERSSEKVPGFSAFRVKRTGRYEKLKEERVVYVSQDGRWFYSGDALANPNPQPVRSRADLEWLDTKFGTLFRTTVRCLLVPERDAAGLKGLALAVETGYGPVRLPGYVSPDGKAFLQGSLWDFHTDPRAERRRRIDLSAGRAQGRADASVNLVEYADMECSYCKYRGLQMDKLLEANASVVNVRRHYKFFPLWFGHVWAMKAASAGDCLFKFAGPALFRFKGQVYSRQESLTLSGIDELAITAAEGEGISAADFLSCYLQEESVARVRKDVEEGYRLGVRSTPTYFIDGTEIAWIEDKVMEDFLRTLFPKTKSIPYEARK